MGFQGPPGPMPTGAALTGIPNTFAASQTINGNLILGGAGSGVQFPDGTTQMTAATGFGGGVPSGSMILGNSPVPPPGYTLVSGSAIGGLWKSVTPMPTTRTALAAAAVNGKVYAIGGFDITNANASNTVEVYDPSSKSWSTAASMPTARFGLAAAAVNGKVYAIGGSGNFANNLKTVEVYDPSSNSWSTAASLPTGPIWAAADANGLIYALGVTDAFPFISLAEEYSPPVTIYIYIKN